ncbi:MAG: tetratricopeptide repeat protein [Microcoleus sp. PH2017_07_MST_O_A]|nr:tetratricopeptide repeat protein [Microcoleus sp. PH2017_07_MST_O_A]
MGSAYHSLGEYQQAIECQLQSLDMARKINSKHRELNCLNALGRTYVSLGENQLAIEYCEKSLNLAPKIDNRYGEANSLVILGNAYSNLGHYLRAIAFYKQSLDIQCLPLFGAVPAGDRIQPQEFGDRAGDRRNRIRRGNSQQFRTCFI